jgi:hypothetical protein
MAVLHTELHKYQMTVRPSRTIYNVTRLTIKRKWAKFLAQ